jgi:hypothetical protein
MPPDDFIRDAFQFPANASIPRDPLLLIGHSKAITRVRDHLKQLARFPWPVRIEGARGTGKNRAARSLHQLSGRSGAFVRCGLNVVSASEGREYAELVGWTRGAFTGAVQSKAGVFERAHRGTAFLNELGSRLIFNGTATYAASRGLVYPLKSSVVRRGLAMADGFVATLVLLDIIKGEAIGLYKEVKAMNAGECQ